MIHGDHRTQLHQINQKMNQKSDEAASCMTRYQGGDVCIHAGK